MNNQPQWPHRLRLYGGRNTHAARPVNGAPDNLVTACGYLAGPKDERKADDAPITCCASACSTAAKEDIGRQPCITARDIERFTANLTSTAPDKCWLWKAALDREGYGRFSMRKRYIAAHRFSYLNYIGPLQPGLVLDHLCRNRACANPAHLEAVTDQQNILRGTAPSAVNARKTHCLRGHELVGENLCVRPGGKRGCRTCRRAANARRRTAQATSKTSMENTR
jgi:hypothetical protein